MEAGGAGVYHHCMPECDACRLRRLEDEKKGTVTVNLTLGVPGKYDVSIWGMHDGVADEWVLLEDGIVKAHFYREDLANRVRDLLNGVQS